MEGKGLRKTMKAGGNITPGSIGVFTTTDRQVLAGGASNCAKIAGVVLAPFNKATAVSGDEVTVVMAGEIQEIRKVTGAGTAIAAGEYVMCGDATGAAAKLVNSGDAAYYCVGFATEASGDNDSIVTVYVNPIIALVASDGVFAGDVTLESGNKISNVAAGTVAMDANLRVVPGTNGGLNIKAAEASATLTGSSTDIAVNVPAGSVILGSQLLVETLITSATATSWAAAYKTGATQAIATGQAFAANTKAQAMFDANAATAIASATTVIAITPNTGTFTAGAIRAITYYLAFETLTSE